jgi:hypothetical protein
LLTGSLSTNYQFRFGAICVLAGAAANRRIVEAHIAAATVVAAFGAAFAAGLQRGAGLLIAAGAMDAAAIGSVFALAIAVGKRALAALQAVLRARAAAAAIAQHAAEILQRGARKLIFATAVDFETAGALFEFHLAPRNHAPVGKSCGREARGLPRLRWTSRRRRAGRESFH